MAKVIFIVESKRYSASLLQIYLERIGYKVFSFFTLNEINLYLKLRPEVIIYNKDEFKIPADFIQFIMSGGLNSLSAIGIGRETIKVKSYWAETDKPTVFKMSTSDIYKQLPDFLVMPVNSNSPNQLLNYSC